MTERWSGDGTYYLPSRQVEPYRLWFEFLKQAHRDPDIEVDYEHYAEWGISLRSLLVSGGRGGLGGRCLPWMLAFVSLGECPVFCAWLNGSMPPERSKDDDDFQRTAGRAAEGLQAA